MNHAGYPTISELDSVRRLMVSGVGEDSKSLTEGNIALELDDAPQKEFLKTIVSRYRNSNKVKNMELSMDYYRNRTEILNSERKFVSASGDWATTDKLSNAKLNHPIISKVVNQKVSFLLSKPFSIQSISDDEIGQLKIADIKDESKLFATTDESGLEFARTLYKGYFNKDFMQKLKNVGRDAVINGVSWLHPHYDDNNKLVFDRIPASNVIPFYRDNDMRQLDAVCYFFDEVVYSQEKGTLKEASRTTIQFFTMDGVYYYVIEDDKIKDDPLRRVVYDSHYTLSVQDKDSNTVTFEKKNWHRVPFVPFRDNWLETSIFEKVGNLVDEYDRTTSTISNLINDVPNSVIVVKNYINQDKAEFTANLATFRTIFIRDDGDVKLLENKFDIANFEHHLKRLKNDIYEGSATVDSQETSLGNASGVALKYRLMDLDVSCADMGNEFETGLDVLIEFILEDLKLSGENSFEDVEYDIVFNTDMIINEEEAVINAQRMKDTLPLEILYEGLPMVIDPKKALTMEQRDWFEKLKREYWTMMTIGELEQSLSPDESTTSKDFGNSRNVEDDTTGSDVTSVKKSSTPNEIEKDEKKEQRKVKTASKKKVGEPKE